MYDNPQVTFPNGVFSGTIISNVIHDGDIKKTAEWQLLLGAIALPGVFAGAWLCNRIGRRNTVGIRPKVLCDDSAIPLDDLGIFRLFSLCKFLASPTWYMLQSNLFLGSHHRPCVQ